MCTENCKDFSKAIRINGAASTGVDVLTDTTLNQFNIVTVINDTDIDVKVSFTNTDGDAGEFIVPKSIRCFTKALKVGKFQPTLFKVAGVGANAVGIITFNFAT